MTTTLVFCRSIRPRQAVPQPCPESEPAPIPAEEADDRGRDDGHEEDEAHGARVGEPGEHGEHGVEETLLAEGRGAAEHLAGEDEPDGDDQRDDRLRDRAGPGGAVLRGAREPRGQHALAAEREEVAGDRVVERLQRREEAREEQDVHNVDEDHADVAVHEHEHQIGARLLRLRDDVRRADTDRERPRAERVEEADDRDGGVGRPRHGALGVLRLLAVDRGALEAHERGDAEDEHDAERGAEELGGIQRGRGDALGSDGERDDVEHDHDEELEGDEHAEHLRREVDAIHAEHADDHDAEQDPQPPWRRESELRLEEHRELEAEETVDADLHRVVRDERDERGADADGAAEALRDVGVEGARVGDVAAHGGVADREHREDHRDHDEAERDAEGAGHREGGGDAARDHGERCGRGDDHQRDRGDAERPAAEPRIVRRRSVGG
ncbi:hypothetical protein CRE_10789 [Caenorhabditis remanei]|uniref:Uncharacterized protein n=1 Tax=Caenorhabditis remanei TaxID=31234 RepID=E3NVK2_CAERE|nr:hypothetical protein CRE_10789 [Caenorhabditis remanei]